MTVFLLIHHIQLDFSTNFNKDFSPLARVLLCVRHLAFKELYYPFQFVFKDTIFFMLSVLAACVTNARERRFSSFAKVFFHRHKITVFFYNFVRKFKGLKHIFREAGNMRKNKVFLYHYTKISGRRDVIISIVLIIIYFWF
jgi:hypothetical protein